MGLFTSSLTRNEKMTQNSAVFARKPGRWAICYGAEFVNTECKSQISKLTAGRPMPVQQFHMTERQ